MSSRFAFPVGLRGGLNTLVNPIVGNPAEAADLQDIILQHGLAEQRWGFNRLDTEPSHYSNGSHALKTRTFLDFDGVNDYAFNSSFVETLGLRWTVRMHFNPFNSPNDTTGTRTLLRLTGGPYDAILFQAIGVTGSPGTIQLRATIKDNAGNTVTLNSTALTIAQWATVGTTSSANFMRITRDGVTLSLYVGDQSTPIATSSSFTLNANPVTTDLFVGATTGAGGWGRLTVNSSLVIVNRVMAEEECYFGTEWPIDETPEGDVVGCWNFNETTGTTVYDYSSHGRNLTLNGPTWNGTAALGARGLGLYTHRRFNGDRYYVVACGRRGTSSAAARPSGALYIWKATQAFQPFAIGGDPANYDATATLDGFDPLARFSFVSVGNNLYAANGVDYARLYGGTTPALTYFGITAPATAPVLSATGTGGGVGAGLYGYCYSYIDPNTGTESGRSPIATITTNALDTVTVKCFGTLDGRVTYIRVYRTQLGGGAVGPFTLDSQGEILNSTTSSYTDTYTDAAILGNTPLPGDTDAGSLLAKRMYLPGGPATTPTMAGVSGGGSVDNGLHYYAQSWFNPFTGQETGMTPIAVAATTGGGNNTVPLSAMDLPDQNSASSGFTQMRIYRTKAGKYVWFLLATVTAAATYSDTAADSTLSSTIELYALPPKCRYAAIFGNRLVIAGNDAAPSTVYVSMAGDHENFPWTGHDFIPHPGAEVTGLTATSATLIISYGDGRVIRVPRMGTDADMPLFLLTAPKTFAPKGGCIAQGSVQATPIGIIWLGRDGLYLAREENAAAVSASEAAGAAALTRISPKIDPTVLNLNRVRARYACSLYMEDEGIYICWVSTGTQRYNEQAIVLDLRANDGAGAFGIWNLHADAAGVLTDANEVPHYCFLMEQGYLSCFDKTSNKDGDGSGALQATVTSAGIRSFAVVAGRTAPPGGDGGIPIHLVKSDGTTVQRWTLDAVMGDGDAALAYFYPSYSALTSGTWTVYYDGIRFRWTSMKTDCDEPRPDKTFQSVFVTHTQENAGGLGVEYAVNSGSFTAVNASPSNADPMTSQASVQAAGRFLQVRLSHSPPKAGETMKVAGLELEFALAGDTQ